MKKVASVVTISALAMMSTISVAYTETIQEKCNRLEREGEKLPPECIKIPLPENPNPAPQPSPKPTPSEEEPPHEAWESPNAGGDDSGSSKPDKPEKPEKPVKPAKPEKDPKPSSSKKPAGSSSSDSEGSSSGGSKRPDTVCGGQFCGEGDTLIGGVGRVEQQRPNKTPVQSDIISDNVKPADKNTSAGQVGTVVETDEGLAIKTEDGIVKLDPREAQNYKAGERAQVFKNEDPHPGQGQVGNGEGNGDWSACIGARIGKNCHQYYDEVIPLGTYRETDYTTLLGESYVPDAEVGKPGTNIEVHVNRTFAVTLGATGGVDAKVVKADIGMTTEESTTIEHVCVGDRSADPWIKSMQAFPAKSIHNYQVDHYYSKSNEFAGSTGPQEGTQVDSVECRATYAM